MATTYFLVGFSKQGNFQDCGPVSEATLTIARICAQQEVERLNTSREEGDEWGVEIELRGSIVARVGWRRNYPVGD